MKFNKKKIACLALASALIIPGVMGLAGCEKGHTHAFNSDPFYEVVLEGETKIARSWRECSCGAENAHKKVNNAIILSPNSEDEDYYVNHIDNSGNVNNLNNHTLVLEGGEWTSAIRIGKNFDNVTIVGTESTVLKNELYLYASKDYGAKNITINRINFQGKNAKFYLGVANKKIENVSVTSCTFDANNETTENQAIHILSGIPRTSANPPTTSEHVHNVNIKNNTINGYKQGALIYEGYNVNIENNVIKNTSHNAIALQTYGSGSNNTTYYYSGDIKIINNTISNTGDRAIRLGVVTDGNIEISGNNFSDIPTDADSGEIEIVKTQLLTRTSYSIKNNVYNNNAVGELIKSNQSVSGIIYSV